MPDIRSYPSIFNVGHREARDLFAGPVVVEEKIDGSQFSFGLMGRTTQLECETDEPDYVLSARSKGKQIDLDAPDKMFELAVSVVRGLASKLIPGWTYRAEYLSRPKHNVIAYDRVPALHVILYDVDRGEQDFLTPAEKAEEAVRLGLECVPIMLEGKLNHAKELFPLLRETSCLGGSKPEGLVIKAYGRYGSDKKTLMAKYVTDEFREDHKTQYKTVQTVDVVQQLQERYRAVPRWRKAVQHLRESGQLTESPRDIGPLIGEICADVEKECADEIKEILFKWAWKRVTKGLTAGFPEWYKKELLAAAFEGTDLDPVFAP